MLKRAGLLHKMVIHSNLTQAKEAADRIVDLVAETGYADEAVFAVKLALEEAVINAIKHGNGNDPGKSVVVKYAVSPREVIIEVADDGCGFCPADVPDPTADENLECPCGRGIMLMRHYMDEVSYGPEGNCVRMVKRNK